MFIPKHGEGNGTSHFLCSQEDASMMLSLRDWSEKIESSPHYMLQGLFRSLFPLSVLGLFACVLTRSSAVHTGL